MENGIVPYLSIQIEMPHKQGKGRTGGPQERGWQWEPQGKGGQREPQSRGRQRKFTGMKMIRREPHVMCQWSWLNIRQNCACVCSVTECQLPRDLCRKGWLVLCLLQGSLALFIFAITLRLEKWLITVALICCCLGQPVCNHCAYNNVLQSNP